jgi:hypothetical protein
MSRGSGKFPRLAAALVGLLVAAAPLRAAPPDAVPEPPPSAAAPAAEPVAEPAATPAVVPAPAPAPTPAAPTPFVEQIDEAYDAQCLLLGEMVGRLDDIFGEQYISDRERKVQLRAGGSVTLNADGVGTDTGVSAGLRVPLPSLERRLNIFLDIGQDVTELNSASDPESAGRQKTASASAGVLGRLGENAEAGVKLSLLWDEGSFMSVYPFVRFEWLTPPMRYFLEQRLIWDNENTWSTRTDFDIDRTFGGGFFLRFRNRGDFTFGDSGAQVAHGLILRRGVFTRSGLSYEAWLEYNTGPDDPDDYDDDTVAYAQVRWRGRVWRRWLEYEVRPAYNVPLEGGRASYFSCFFSLTVIWDSYLGGVPPPGVSAQGDQAP